jgi:phosphoglycerol transferase MdoB-like AlkP superfamily enzyme
MESIKIENMLTLEETIAKDLFEGATYPWEVLPKIGDFIKELGKTGIMEKSVLVVYGDHGAGLTCTDNIRKLYEEIWKSMKEYHK